MLTRSESIFAVSDVRETIAYYRSVLGFETEWLWGHPPTFGGVGWGKIHLMFCLAPDLQQHIDGHQHMFFSEDIQSLYEKHKTAGANIVSDIGNKPWGVREYTVRDLNGYHLRFGGPEKYEKPASVTDTLPAHIKIERRLPTADEFLVLTNAVKWKESSNINEVLAGSTFGHVAIDTKTNRVVGMTRVVRSASNWYGIWDVVVHPDYQGQKVGSTLLEATIKHLKETVEKGAIVYLFTFKQEFYERLGFTAEKSMLLRI